MAKFKPSSSAMPNSQNQDRGNDQSARFIEAAKKAGVDESGRKFARAMKKVALVRPAKKAKQKASG